ncbi:flagellum biosynthesis repressor protein FlbT [Methylobacterium adhaesivum]|jgi:flagellar protein FlbT|uniref:Flagellar biosynthesis repressor FlbT n=1 Tax=Methylobacterium adhaesivum TaxID=333297 RepID=A0ABT8BN25_9HYPH|nr:flagellar biosynthesis repressor FlbT [Methylobacterium adhaesivum]MDN3592643.1 flagellar biosynthesis repressor FlbT [Methylobacterium adhaesivum]GJD30247.1 flagellum biosynthesis repressor protein FlbT [Methylobacterium adhaesivum]
MPLKIELKPFERLLIGGTAIRNGSRRSSFVIETVTNFLRESDIILESEADTACKRLYLTLTVLYLAEPTQEAEALLVNQASALLEAVPSTAPYLSDILAFVADREFYRALKRCKDLIQYEQSLSSRLAESE